MPGPRPDLGGVGHAQALAAGTSGLQRTSSDADIPRRLARLCSAADRRLEG